MRVQCLILATLAVSVAGLSTVTAAADRQLVEQVKDPTTGLAVRVFVGGPADVSIELGDRTVTVQKAYAHGQSITTLATSGDRVQLTTAPGRLVLDGTGGRLEAVAGDAASMARIRERLARSEAVQRGVALLGSLNLGLRSPVGHALLATRAMLLSEIGRSDGFAEMARWVASARQALAVQPVAFQNGPGDCWNQYAKEAIANYSELEDCMRDVKWYDLLGDLDCGSIYDLRAIGDFSWYLHCVALR